QEGYSTIVCHDFQSAKQVIEQQYSDISLCLFDLSLPDGSGYDLCQLVKERQDIPVIFLTVMDDEVNVVMGLDLGADDYITKPFRIRELLSRIKSVLRRYHRQAEQQPMITIGDIHIHVLQGKVYKKGKEVTLTALEYRLLLMFAHHI